MIEFDRSKDTLEALSSKGNITLEDVLGVFLDLCEDVKSGGSSVDNLNVTDQDKLLANLSRSGRLFLKIMKKKADQMDVADAVERIKRQEEQIASRIEGLEQKTDTLVRTKAQLNDKISALENQKLQYEQKMDDVNKKHQYYSKLSSKCEQMESLITEMDNVSIGPMENRLASLTAELEKRNNNLKKIEADVAVFKDNLKSKTMDYEEKSAEHDELEQQVKKLEEGIKLQKQLIDQLSKEEFDKQAMVQKLQNRQNQLQEHVISLQNEIDRLREHLANSDYDNLLIEKENLIKETMILDEAVARETAECEKLRAALQETRDEQIARKDFFEKEQSRISDENTQLISEIDSITLAISNDEKEKIQLEKALSDAENRHRMLQKWFESLEVNKYDERLKNALQKISIFEEAQKELFYETDDLGLTQTISMQEANEKKDELRRQLKEIESLFDAYQRKYYKICELLSD